MKDNKEYKFDAFISYRHCELDKFVAENLHKILEKYELPKNIKKKLNIKNRTIKRVFRDQEELPLSSNLEDPIVDALNNSKYLIVICSPRLKDSLWCKKEIETFKKLRGRKNIFCVLIEGEPVDSFPEDLLTDDDNKTPVEPLAADVRGKNKKEVLKKIKSEKLRLVAPMYNLDYDDLRQRHKLRKQKRIINISIIIAIALLLFSLYTSAMLIKINSQQKKLKLHQATSLASDSKELFTKDNRYEAIKNAYQSLTEFEGVKMPYTAEAEYALAESLGLYDVGSSYKIVKSINTNGVIEHITSSNKNKYAAMYDGSETLTLFTTSTLNIIKTFDVSNRAYYDTSYGFIGDDAFAYINTEGNIIIVNTKDGKKITEIKKENDSYDALAGDSNGNYLAYADKKKLYIYDIKAKKVIYEFNSNDHIEYDIYFTTDSDYLFVSTIYRNDEYSLEAEEEITIHVIDIKEKEEINSVKFTAGYIDGLITRDNNAYILMNKMQGVNYGYIVASYDYINGNLNWSRVNDGHWGTYINKTYLENNYIAVVNNSIVNVLDGDSGELYESFSFSSDVIDIYSYYNNELLLVFTADGEVGYIDINSKKSMVVPGRYILNATPYTEVEIAEHGFILTPYNDTRAILYERKTNEQAKELDIKLDYLSNDSISSSECDAINIKYNINNKNLVANMLYDDKKELLFVNYKNGDITIYDTKNKKVLKELKEVGKTNHYFGKDKYGRIYIGDLSDAYIIDKNYNLVGHISSLAKLEKDSVIIYNSNNGKYYSVKIYTLDELKKEAKKYLSDNK